MNVYEVVLKCKRHYGNGHYEFNNEAPQKIIAKDGDEAVSKAKKRVAYADPKLHSLSVLVEGAE